MTAEQHYDVIIIGTGPGGGTLAHALAPTGKRILLLERGDFLPQEQDNWNPDRVLVEEKYKNAERWHDRDGKPFQPGQHYWVGGNSKMYGAVLLRLREQDFGEVNHHDGVSPAWPLSYADFEPYYNRAEKLYHVHGEGGIDPTDPPRSEPYAYPPIPHDPRIARLEADLRRLGHTPFPLPVGIKLNDKDTETSPFISRELFQVTGTETFDGYPDLIQAKADAESICVRPALQHKNVTLLTNAFVKQLETNASGRVVSRVVVERAGAAEYYSADIVVVSCGAINSAALLLRSSSDKHPNGLANSSDMVGRHYMTHNNSALMTISKEPNPTKFQKTLGLNDFYFGADDWEYPLGHIQMLGKSNASLLRAMKAHHMVNMVLEKMAEHSLDFWLTSEDLPLPENRVTLDSKGGIVINYTPNNTEAHDRLIAKLRGMLGDIGCENHLLPCAIYMGKKIPIAGVGHQNGTCRFGTNPQTSVLDISCKAHDLDNLYVVDSSFFVSSSAVNPTLTIIANALRVGEHLSERLGV